MSLFGPLDENYDVVAEFTKVAKGRADVEAEVAAQEAHRSARLQAVAAAHGLGFTQDSPYVDGPMTCPRCFGLAMPERAREHMTWHEEEQR